MAVTDYHVAMIQARLAGAFDEYDKLIEQFQQADVKPTAYLVFAGFVRAMKARFPRTDDPRAAIIRYVGDLRAKSAWRASEIDPRLAEQLIQHALGREPAPDIPFAATHRIRVLLLRAMVVERQIDAAGLADFLARARHLADLHLIREEPGRPHRAETLPGQALRAALAGDEATSQQAEERFGPSISPSMPFSSRPPCASWRSPPARAAAPGSRSSSWSARSGRARSGGRTASAHSSPNGSSASSCGTTRSRASTICRSGRPHSSCYVHWLLTGGWTKRSSTS